MAVLRYDEAIDDRLFPANGRSYRVHRLVRRHQHWSGEIDELVSPVLLVRDDGQNPRQITGLCVVRLGKRVGDFDRRLRVERVHGVGDPIPWVDLMARLSEAESNAVAQLGGRLRSDVASRVVTELLVLRPGLAGSLGDLLDSPQVDLSGAAGQRLAQEKDAVGALLTIAGMPRDILRDWSGAAPDVPFLDGLPQQEEYETTLIAHDAGRFAGWIPAPVSRPRWRRFVRGTQELFVMNADSTSVEHSLGVDMVYFHEQRQSFVLVQYKKLSRSGQGDWIYRPDARMRSQLDRMRAVDADCATDEPEADFRLLPTPCMVKLCRPDVIDVDSDALLEGMYLPRELFEQLIGDGTGAVRGPRGGPRIVHDPQSRHLSNTLFTGLVGGGWIGSTGTGTTLVMEQLKVSLGEKRAVVLGVRSDGRPTKAPVPAPEDADSALLDGVQTRLPF